MLIISVSFSDFLLVVEIGKNNCSKGDVSLTLVSEVRNFVVASELLHCLVTSVNRYALLGAASFLGGSMRMTVSLCVIMVEITNNLQLLPLIMLVLLISKVTNLYFILFPLYAFIK